MKEMVTYAALVRGIGPGDPRKTNDKLRSVLETLGFSNVKSVISSGNLVFESDITDTHELETIIEDAWSSRLGFQATTIVRSQRQLQQLLDTEPFNNTPHTNQSYLLTTFLKHPTKPNFDIPFQPLDKPYVVVAYTDGVLCTVTDNTILKTTDLMTWLEKQFGKEITSRTPLTIQRILKRMQT